MRSLEQIQRDNANTSTICFDCGEEKGTCEHTIEYKLAEASK